MTEAKTLAVQADAAARHSIAREVARQVFSLCEQFEGLPAFASDSREIERFKAGQRFAAKRIRNAIGNWVTHEDRQARLDAAADHEPQLRQARHDAAAEIERLQDLLRWAYSKLHDRQFRDLPDALRLDEMKLLLEHGI